MGGWERREELGRNEECGLGDGLWPLAHSAAEESTAVRNRGEGGEGAEAELSSVPLQSADMRASHGAWPQCACYGISHVPAIFTS
mmetsp:Transcript_18211/g.52618  ORF Transcript_18211/g.52618 Transcript_18211/m.52618 type:complete len:85 (+) Transcript_18211:698-952(+)